MGRTIGMIGLVLSGIVLLAGLIISPVMLFAYGFGGFGLLFFSILVASLGTLILSTLHFSRKNRGTKS
jgi:hypothetical protein